MTGARPARASDGHRVRGPLHLVVGVSYGLATANQVLSLRYVTRAGQVAHRIMDRREDDFPGTTCMVAGHALVSG